MRGFLIAAPQSGSGKTTVSLAIMAALVRRGLEVAPFKSGPDFIDPGYHRLVTGRPSINLDGWMCGEEFVLQTFLTGIADERIAVIEGAMGLFDGIGASAGDGSSARIASITGAPVLLVVNAAGMAASAAAMVLGFAGFDPGIIIAGVIFNNVGSESHATLLKEALAAYCPEITCFGCIPRDETVVIPSRHLGLVTADDNPLSEEFICRLADMAERCIELERLVKLEIQCHAPLEESEEISGPLIKRESEEISTVRIAVARDRAFCFIYDDNLRLLKNAGAEPVFFSPLKDAAIPDDVHGIYLPGGYPELFAEELAANRKMIENLRAVVATGMPVYAECGGFIYLTRGLETSENKAESDFVGIYPVRALMLPRRKALGYRDVEIIAESIIGFDGMQCRGHEFHYSEISAMPDDIERCFRVTRQGVLLGMEGYRVRNCLASYIHLHFGSNSGIATTFADACRRRQAGM